MSDRTGIEDPPEDTERTERIEHRESQDEPSMLMTQHLIAALAVIAAVVLAVLR